MILLLITALLPFAFPEEPRLECNKICIHSSSDGPVCGNDWNTYTDTCALTKQACRLRKALVVVYNGRCTGTKPVVISHNGRISTSFTPNKQGCIDISCPTTYRPVCGSDGQRYSNACHLRKRSCFSRSPITHVMDLDTQQTDCDRSSCTRNCKRSFIKICGSDGTTYDSMCHLKRASCQTNVPIIPLHLGPCKMISE